ncbi:hypothetical protein IJM86_02625 [bacterium]|nr:hypothetical protein [bacterium]
MEVWQNLKLLGEDYGFSLTTSLSPKKIALQGKNFIEKVSLQSLEEEFDMSLEQKKGKNRILNFFKTLHGEKILKGSLGVNFKNDETIVFQGSLYDKAKELVNGLYFQLNFE